MPLTPLQRKFRLDALGYTAIGYLYKINQSAVAVLNPDPLQNAGITQEIGKLVSMAMDKTAPSDAAVAKLEKMLTEPTKAKLRKVIGLNETVNIKKQLTYFLRCIRLARQWDEALGKQYKVSQSAAIEILDSIQCEYATILQANAKLTTHLKSTTAKALLKLRKDQAAQQQPTSAPTTHRPAARRNFSYTGAPRGSLNFAIAKIESAFDERYFPEVYARKIGR
jgi:hypothetical protein